MAFVVEHLLLLVLLAVTACQWQVLAVGWSAQPLPTLQLQEGLHKLKGTPQHSTETLAQALSKLQDESKLNQAEISECVQFLYKHLPKGDRGRITKEHLRSNTVLALAARAAHPWSEAVPWHLFLNDVLPYANLDEPRDEWRVLFTPLFAPLVANASSLTEAAQILNRDIWDIWGIFFKSNQTPEILSPSQVIEAGFASCTGLSIFLVDACRAVGIPARVAGTPSWVITSNGVRHVGLDHPNWNNHDWVEVWDDDHWSFLGAAEYDIRGPNHTWFFPEPAKHQLPASKYHAIYAASYAQTPACGDTTFPLVWNKKWAVPGCDVTQSYLDTPDNV